MIYYGVELALEDYTFMVLDGEPELMLAESGIRKMAQHAPNQKMAREVIRYLDSRKGATER